MSGGHRLSGRQGLASRHSTQTLHVESVHPPQNLRLAWRRVASNRGARSSGVDKVTVKHIETRIGIERFLTMTRATLLDGSYRPHPVRRVMIPTRGPGLFRPLGVPTVHDRV